LHIHTYICTHTHNCTGWNILYDFAQSDISICTLQLKIFLDDYETIPYKVLQYLFSEVNYGGRITDDKVCTFC